ncbi:MAG: Ku protein [Solirubrobacteraceae bacterium]|nr:Ku protein [Solirubrobacteraceae bacterium]
MPRPIWSGSISFGLVNVPVQLYGATRDRSVRFHQVRAGTGEAIETRRVAEGSDDEVDWAEIARGWETDDGRLVVLLDEDLDRAAPERTRTVDVELFVDLEEIDPIHFDHPYWLVPRGEGEGPARAYRLLRDVLADSDRVAIGRIVIRAREQLVAIRERQGLLSLTTMRFAEEIRDPHDTGAVPTDEASAPSDAEVDDAVALLEEMTVDWDPTSYADAHRERLLALVEEKRRNGEVREPDPEDEPVPQVASKDLLAALEESLDRIRGDRKRPGTRSPAKRGGVGSSGRKPSGTEKAKAKAKKA